MMLKMKLLNLLILMLPFVSLQSFSFEGKIKMVKETCFDTTYSTYYVSGNLIRIEEANSQNQVTGIYLLDLSSNEITFIHPEKQIYTKLRKKNYKQSNAENFDIKKTENFKYINGAKCYQWRVKNREKNTEVAYWVTQNNFVFFEKMVSLLNQYEMNWKFFGPIPEKQGFFPMISEERTLVRDQKMRTSVLQINPKMLDQSMFKIPEGYKRQAM